MALIERECDDTDRDPDTHVIVLSGTGKGFCGGYDLEVYADLVVMADDAVIGYPPAKVWGVPTTMMWVSF